MTKQMSFFLKQKNRTVRPFYFNFKQVKTEEKKICTTAAPY